MDGNMDGSFKSIEQLIDIPYATETRVARRKGKNSTSEFFTPSSLVSKMCDKIPSTDWSDPTKTFLEPCFGNGNFLVEIIRRRIVDYSIDWKIVLNNLYGVELMPDNVQEAKDRIIELLKTLNIDFNEQEARDIMDKNLVCSDFFKWDFENWRPISERSKELF